jgi:LuxR family transcriptional regulator, quorum-sensing system regulator LasR
MSMDLDSILGEFATAEGSPTVAFDVLKRIGRALGYDHAIAAYAPKVGDRQSMFLASTYSEVWKTEQERLTTTEALQDPIVSHLKSRIEPIYWSKSNYDKSGQMSLYERFRDLGLGSGIALAVRGLNGEMLSVGFSNSEQVEIGSAMPVAQMGALYLSATAMFNRIAVNLEKQKKKQLIPEDAPKLTPREIECLQWARVGKTSWEVAKILGISQATSIFHMKNAISKLDASNKTHAVMVAVERGLIG